MARRKPAAPPQPAPAPVDGSGAAIFVAITLFLAPAAGMPVEEMLQDTLKSIVVSFGTLAAAAWFLWRSRERQVQVHAFLLLPLGLAAYALGSMAWSHTYLAGVEAVRWLVFALLGWVVLNVATPRRLDALAWGVHLGGVVASAWAVLQFVADFQFFAQGPPPASTFVNRNFFAEFAVCTLPFGAWLLARSRTSARVFLVAAGSAVTVAALLMTGTRAALIALWVELLVLLPLAAWWWRDRWTLPGRLRWSAAAVFAAVVLVLAALPCGNPTVMAEGRGTTGLQRAVVRTASIGPADESLGLRVLMWKATMRMIVDRPWSGVGAGAWEVQIPLYQAEGSQLETDYYVHNEYLQLLAEYGVAGWLFLVALAWWLLDVARRTLFPRSDAEGAEAPWRAVLLASLLAFLIVSNVGFPWRMAATGALFALCLGGLAASEVRAPAAFPWAGREVPWTAIARKTSLVALVVATALAAYITQRAARAESAIVQATRLAMGIARSSDPASPSWAPVKEEMHRLAREGVALNPHYRKITPIIADEVASWGDWSQVLWIWESVLESRPHIVAIMANLARGYIVTGDLAKAQAYIDRGQRIQPHAPSLLAAQVIVYAREGRPEEALAAGRTALSRGVQDFAMATTIFQLARDRGDFTLAERALLPRLQRWDVQRAQGWYDLARLYVRQGGREDDAVEAFRQALQRVPPAEREQLMDKVPASLRARVAQTSASKG